MIKIILLQKVETAVNSDIRSRFVMDFSSSDAIWGPVVFLLTENRVCMGWGWSIPARWQGRPHTEGDTGIGLKVAKEGTVWAFVGKLPNTEQPKGKDT